MTDPVFLGASFDGYLGGFLVGFAFGVVLGAAVGWGVIPVVVDAWVALARRAGQRRRRDDA